jgi:hypothetical protein
VDLGSVEDTKLSTNKQHTHTHIDKHNPESSAIPKTSRWVPVTEIQKDSPGKIGELGKSSMRLVFEKLAENGHFFGV